MNKLNLKETIKILEKKYGKNTVMKLNDKSKINIPVIPTGSVSLDYALGVGGIPRGRIIEIYGPEASGKTTLSLHIIAEAQKQNIKCVFIDAEYGLDPEYAKKIGVDIEKLYISQPDSGEQALDIVESFVKSDDVGLIVIDSVAALTPQAEIDGEMGHMFIGLQARLMSQALRKLTAISSKSNTTIIFINQIRMKIGQMWGSPETTSGGIALKFYTSVRIEVRRSAKLKKDDEQIGSRIKVKVAKNKVAQPFKTTEFDILYDRGISKVNDVFNFALKYDILKQKGHTIYYNDEKVAVGKESTIDTLQENKELLEKIVKDIKNM